MRKCCLYQTASGRRYTLPTTEDSCPDVVGDTNLGEWEVGSYEECRIYPDEIEPPPEFSATEPPLTEPPIGPGERDVLRVKGESPWVEFFERLKDIPAAVALLKKYGLWPPPRPELRK